MNTFDALTRLRSTDPGRGSAVPWSADDLLTAFAGGGAVDGADHSPDEAADAAPAAHHRPRNAPTAHRRRWAVVAAAAALLLSSPVWWPGSPAPSSTALAVTQEGDAVHVTVPRPVDPLQLQQALDRAGVRATVVQSSADCTTPFPEGLREGYKVAPPEQNFTGADDAAFRFTFYPDRAPAGSTVLFGVEPGATTLLLVSDVPPCLPLSTRSGPTG